MNLRLISSATLLASTFLAAACQTTTPRTDKVAIPSDVPVVAHATIGGIT
jgi:uncharacterized lipoprotein YajG